MDSDWKDIVRNTYNKVANNYSDTRGIFLNTEYLDKFAALLKPGASVLDLGCGAGVPVDKFLVDKGFKVTGIDLSESQIRLAKKNVPEGMFDVKDMSDLKSGDYSVDAVVSFYAIFHVPRETHLGLFQKIYSFLTDDGVMLVTMATTDWEGVDEDFYGEKMFESHYEPVKNTEIVREAGFEILLDTIDTSGNEKHQVILARKH